MHKSASFTKAHPGDVVRMQDLQGEKMYAVATFSWACGKTKFAMLIPPPVL